MAYFRSMVLLIAGLCTVTALASTSPTILLSREVPVGATALKDLLLDEASATKAIKQWNSAIQDLVFGEWSDVLAQTRTRELRFVTPVKTTIGTMDTSTIKTQEVTAVQEAGGEAVMLKETETVTIPYMSSVKCLTTWWLRPMSEGATAVHAHIEVEVTSRLLKHMHRRIKGSIETAAGELARHLLSSAVAEAPGTEAEEEGDVVGWKEAALQKAAEWKDALGKA
ncbi:unnamed protein product [Chrysoparadoxa australica]